MGWIEKQKELLHTQISLKKRIIVTLMCGFIFSLLEISFIGRFVNENIARKVEFSFRHYLDRSPNIDPRIKIYAIDDKTAAELQSSDLSISQWISLVKSIKEREPKAIFIDKLFTLYNGTTKEAEELVQAFQEGSPVYAGSFGISTDISGRKSLDVTSHGLDSFDLLDSVIKPKNADQTVSVLEKISWFPKASDHLFFYGPAEPFLPAFKKLGHLGYIENDHINPFIWPDFKKNKTRWIIPHLSLLAADKLTLSEKSILVNDFEVPLDQHHTLIINLSEPKAYYKNTFSIRSALSRIKNHLPLQEITKDDVIVIISSLSTGNVELQKTPSGLIPGSFLVVSLINSVLTNNWLVPLNFNLSFIWIATLLGALAASFLWQSGVIICLVVLPLIFLIAGLLSFSYSNIVFPWMLPGLSAAITGLIILGSRFRTFQTNSVRLKESLGKMLPEKRLSQILKNPDSLQLEPSEQVVTLMFIDIVGFSLSAEGHTPKEIFSELKQFFAKLRKTIHQHGGVIDKSLGDGLLCFFGYNYEKNKQQLDQIKSQNHAEQAFTCAIDIQKEILKESLDRFSAGKTVYPLRIGINTSSVYIGDLGDEESLDFTLIGHGVNFAKRFEESCELFKIMLSPTTKLALATSQNQTTVNLLKDIKLRYLKTKHHSEPMEAYEFDPFINDQKSLNKAVDAYAKAAGLERKEVRWPLPQNIHIPVASTSSAQGNGELLDFSKSGFAIKLDRYFARSVELSLYIGERQSPFYEKLHNAGLQPLIGEVRWGKIVGQEPHTIGYIHGVLIKNLNTAQKNLLVTLIREHIETKDSNSKV